MLNEEILERLSERLVNRIEELNLFMIEKLGEQIVDIGTLTPSQLREVFQSVKYGNNLDEIVNKIADITDKNVEDIYEIFEEVAKQCQKYARQFYEYKNIKFIPFEENQMLQQQVRSIAKATVDEYINMSQTIAYTFYNDSGIREFSSLSETYQKITDRAILNLSQGRESFDMVMKRTMRELTSQGLRTVDYASGYSRRMDSSVRMNLMDGVRRLNRELQTQFGEEFGADGIEVSHHKNAAPDHIDTVDGKQFSINGEVTIKGIKYQDYDTVNDSLKRHIGELNCYHFIYSIVLGVSKPLYSKEKLEADKKDNVEGFEFEGKHYTMYEGTQLQRQIETKIRQYKDRQIGAKAINDTDEVYHCQEKIRQLTQKYKELSDVSGLPTKIDRLRVEGYKKTTIPNNYKEVTQEWLNNKTDDGITIDAKSVILNGKEYFVNESNKINHINNEVPIAELTVKTFGGKIEYLPDIGEENNVRCGDCFYKDEIWDIKELGEKATSTKRAIDNLLKDSKGQSNNFILDITSSKLDRDNILKQVQKIYSTNGRQWINKIIIFDNKRLLEVIERNKKRG